MKHVLVTSNDAGKVLCSDQNTKERFKRNLWIRSWSMNHHQVDGNQILHHKREKKEHFSDVDH